MSFGAVIRIGEVPLPTAAKPDSRGVFDLGEKLFVGVALVAVLSMNVRRVFDTGSFP